jgi:Gas vesicle synthesis protein GvpL/GvpF
MELYETAGSGQEWRVRVHVDLSVDGPHGSPAASPLREQDDVFIHEPRWQQAEARAAQIGQALSDIALAARQYPAPDPPLVGSAGRTVLNGAYLLPAEHVRGFAATVHELTREHAALSAELSGPWPPFTFAAGQVRELTVVG